MKQSIFRNKYVHKVPIIKVRNKPRFKRCLLFLSSKGISTSKPFTLADWLSSVIIRDSEKVRQFSILELAWSS